MCEKDTNGMKRLLENQVLFLEIYEHLRAISFVINRVHLKVCSEWQIDLMNETLDLILDVAPEFRTEASAYGPCGNKTKGRKGYDAMIEKHGKSGGKKSVEVAKQKKAKGKAKK